MLAYLHFVKQKLGYSITLSTQVCIIKAMLVCLLDFPIAMYRCENGTIMKAEHPRMDAFELWCWNRLLRQQGGQTSQS